MFFKTRIIKKIYMPFFETNGPKRKKNGKIKANLKNLKNVENFENLKILEKLEKLEYKNIRGKLRKFGKLKK